MTDYTIQGLTVSDTSVATAGLAPKMVRQVIFYIGKRGPFYLQFDLAGYTPEAVILGVQNEVKTLQAIDSGLEQG